MECDIHAHVETGYVNRDGEMFWTTLCDFHFGRNYTLFTLMAGVRRYNYLPDAKALEIALEKRGVKTLDDPLLSEAESEIIVLEASDSGITKGQPSFPEKGMPKDIGFRTASAYTYYVVEDGDNEEDSERHCSRSQAESWIKSGSSEPWDVINDKIITVTGPDWHTPSWLSTDEMEVLAERFRTVLKAEVPEFKRIQKQNLIWAKNGLEEALKANDTERIAMMKRELEREQNWSSHNPLKSETLAKVEGLASLMKRIEQDGQIKARLVFWFDN